MRLPFLHAAYPLCCSDFSKILSGVKPRKQADITTHELGLTKFVRRQLKVS